MENDLILIKTFVLRSLREHACYYKRITDDLNMILSLIRTNKR